MIWNVLNLNYQGRLENIRTLHAPVFPHAATYTYMSENCIIKSVSLFSIRSVWKFRHLNKVGGVVWWGRGVVYLTSPGCPTDIGLLLGKAAKGRGGIFLFLLFLHFRSFSSFFPFPLFPLFYYLFYLSSFFLWATTQNDPQRLTCR